MSSTLPEVLTSASLEDPYSTTVSSWIMIRRRISTSFEKTSPNTTNDRDNIVGFGLFIRIRSNLPSSFRDASLMSVDRTSRCTLDRLILECLQHLKRIGLGANLQRSHLDFVSVAALGVQ